MAYPAFTSGSSANGQPSNPTLTPDAIERRQALAAALLKQGMDYSPIQSPWQGVARVTEALSGALQSGWADQDAAAARKADADTWTRGITDAYGNGGQGAATGTGQAGMPTGQQAVGTTPNTGDIGTNLAPDGLQKHAFDHFVAQGYTPAAAAGLVGNFQQESGFSPSNIAAVSGGGDGGVSKHLAQWNGPRLAGLNAFAAAQGKSPSDFDTQLAYVDHELQTTEKATGDALKGVNDPGQAAYIAAGYERPQGWKQGGSAGLINGWNNRLKYAQAAYNQFGGSGSPAPVAAAAPAQQAPPNQVASADPNFAPQLPPSMPPQASVPAPNGQFPNAQELASLRQNGVLADGGPGTPAAAPNLPAAMAPPPGMAFSNPNSGAPAGPQPMSGAAAAPEMARLGLQPNPVANGAPMPPQMSVQGNPANPQALAQALAASQGGNPAPSANIPTGPATPLPLPAPVASPMAVAGPGAPSAAPTGQAAVTQAMAAPSPAPAPAPPRVSTPGAQAVTQALAPPPVQQQQPFTQEQMQRFGAIMASPWTSDSQKAILARAIQQRMAPVDYSYQTTPDGTILRMDPRGGEPVPVYRAAPKPIPKHFENVNGRIIASDEITGASSDVTPQGLPSGYRPATDQERQQYQVAPGTPLIFGPDGKPTTLGPQTSVNIQNGENAFDKKSAELQAGTLNDIATDGYKAKQDLGEIANLRQAVTTLPGGFWGGAQQIANSYGIKLGDNASNVEYADAILSRLTPQQRQGMPGAASDRDVAMFKSALPKLSNTAQGNALIMDTMQAMGEYRVKQGEIANAVLTGDLKRSEGIKALQALPDPFESFRKQWGAGQQQAPDPSSHNSPSGAVIPPAAQAPAAAPQPGTVMKGYRFNGGDPSKQENWEKVQ